MPKQIVPFFSLFLARNNSSLYHLLQHIQSTGYYPMRPFFFTTAPPVFCLPSRIFPSDIYEEPSVWSKNHFLHDRDQRYNRSSFFRFATLSRQSSCKRRRVPMIKILSMGSTSRLASFRLPLYLYTCVYILVRREEGGGALKTTRTGSSLQVVIILKDCLLQLR